MWLHNTLISCASILFLCLPLASQAQLIDSALSGTEDMQRCEDELDALQLAVRSARQRAASANRVYADLDQCRNSADGDGLKDASGQCDNLKWDYQNETGDLELEFRQLAAQLESVQLACGIEFNLKRSR